MIKSLPYLVVLVTTVFYSCSSNHSSDNFEIQGKIEGMPDNELVMLDELGLDNELKIIDSSRSNAKGIFTLKGLKDKEQKLYRIRMGNRSIFVLNDGDVIKVKGKWKTLEDEYEVKGSGGSNSLKKMILGLNNYERKTASLLLSLDSLMVSGNANDSLVHVAQVELQKTNQDCLSFLRNYTDSTKYLPVAILSIVFTHKLDNGLLENEEQMNKVLSSIEKRFGNQEMVLKFKQLILSSKENIKTAKVKPNQPAPAFTLKDVNGKSVSLNQFKGKYVLLDFWASWCAPCRHENPNVVAAYNSFKDKNFAVLGVSLDTDAGKWKKAISDDQLDWTNVSDLGGWNSAVVDLYGIESIPTNFLIDPNGNVIAKGLFGPALQAKLNELFANQQP